MGRQRKSWPDNIKELMDMTILRSSWRRLSVYSALRIGAGGDNRMTLKLERNKGEDEKIHAKGKKNVLLVPSTRFCTRLMAY